MSTTRVFCYGKLNVKDVQRAVWQEPKEGVHGRLIDYEMKLWPETDIPYVEYRIGETVVGKTYDLSEEQLARTDAFHTDSYKRITLRDGDNKDFCLYIKKPPEEPKKFSFKKKGKKSKKSKQGK